MPLCNVTKFHFVDIVGLNCKLYGKWGLIPQIVPTKYLAQGYLEISRGIFIYIYIFLSSNLSKEPIPAPIDFGVAMSKGRTVTSLSGPLKNAQDQMTCALKSYRLLYIIVYIYIYIYVGGAGSPAWLVVAGCPAHTAKQFNPQHKDGRTSEYGLDIGDCILYIYIYI